MRCAIFRQVVNLGLRGCDRRFILRVQRHGMRCRRCKRWAETAVEPHPADPEFAAIEEVEAEDAAQDFTRDVVWISKE